MARNTLAPGVSRRVRTIAEKVVKKWVSGSYGSMSVGDAIRAQKLVVAFTASGLADLEELASAYQRRFDARGN